jgi:DNA polymerase-3 subunit gamma/tau
MDLTSKYRPSTLSEIYGQDRIVSFFKSVIANVDTAPHYFLLSGAYGTGKTAIVRAFARDLLGSLNAPNYVEIDSGEKILQTNFDAIKNILFQEVPGYKVAVLDESHLVEVKAQEQLLKVVEDYYGKLILFFATTEPHKMMDTLRSRLHHFSLALFSDVQLIEYAKFVLEKEGKSISDQALSLAALNSQGHMRNMIMQVDLILFQGEEDFLQSYASVLKGIKLFFTDFSLADQASVEALARWHPAELRSLMGHFFRQSIINPDGENKDTVPRHLVPKLFASYLRLFGLVKEPDDFFSASLVFRQQLRALKRVGV